MLEGLEITIISYSKTILNKDFRIDTDFWTKEPKLNTKLKYGKIGDYLLSSQYGISIEMNENEVGYPIYRMNEIHNMFCDFDVAKYADIKIAELSIFKLNDRDVLFNRTNSYEWVGRTGIYKKTTEHPFIFASYLVRFVPNQNFLLPEYLTAFLNTKYGIWDIKRRARQSINQTNINPEEVKQVDIPLLEMEVQKFIKNNFDKAFKILENSKSFYFQAEQLLLDELGLKNWQPSAENSNTKSFKESYSSTGRLDAEYYQPKYELLLTHLKQFDTKKLGLIVKIQKSIEPGSEAYEDKGIPFIRVSNLSKFGITDTEIHLNKEEYQSFTPKPKKDTILLTKDGSVGIAFKVENDLDVVTSSALLHLTVADDEFLPDYLTLVLNSIVVKLQAERDAGGSIIQHWKPSEIEQIVIPKLPISKQHLLAEKIQKSFKLKHQSEHLLEVAKHAVEIAIEQDEKAATQYIQQNTKKV